MTDAITPVNALPAGCRWGADDDSYAVRMKLKHYMKYVRSAEHAAADDSPLYIFDGTFASRRGSRGMRREYAVPPYFREDLMSLAGEKRRPPYRSASIAHELITFPGHNAHLTAPANCIIRALLADAASVWQAILNLYALYCDGRCPVLAVLHAGGLSWGRLGAALGCTSTLWRRLPGTPSYRVTSAGSCSHQVTTHPPAIQSQDSPCHNGMLAQFLPQLVLTIGSSTPVWPVSHHELPDCSSQRQCH